MTAPLPSALLACFFCGVDSKAVLLFLMLFVICLVLGSASFLVWAIARGDFKNVESAKYDVFHDPETGVPGAITIEPLNPKAKT